MLWLFVLDENVIRKREKIGVGCFSSSISSSISRYCIVVQFLKQQSRPVLYKMHFVPTLSKHLPFPSLPSPLLLLVQTNQYRWDGALPSSHPRQQNLCLVSMWVGQFTRALTPPKNNNNVSLLRKRHVCSLTHSLTRSYTHAEKKKTKRKKYLFGGRKETIRILHEKRRSASSTLVAVSRHISPRPLLLDYRLKRCSILIQYIALTVIYRCYLSRT